MAKVILFACDIAGTFIGNVEDEKKPRSEYIKRIIESLEKIRLYKEADKVIFSFITGDFNTGYLLGSISEIKEFLTKTVCQDKHFYSRGLVNIKKQGNIETAYEGYSKADKLKEYIEDLKRSGDEVVSLIFAEDDSRNLKGISDINIEVLTLLVEGIPVVSTALEGISCDLEKQKASQGLLLLGKGLKTNFDDYKIDYENTSDKQKQQVWDALYKVKSPEELYSFLRKYNINFLLPKIASLFLSGELSMSEILKSEYHFKFFKCLLMNYICESYLYSTPVVPTVFSPKDYTDLMSSLYIQEALDTKRGPSWEEPQGLVKLNTLIDKLKYSGVLNSSNLWALYGKSEEFIGITDNVLRVAIARKQYEFYTAELKNPVRIVREAKDSYVLGRALKVLDQYSLKSLLGVEINCMSDMHVNGLFEREDVDPEALEGHIKEGRILVYKAHPTKREEPKHSEMTWAEEIPF